MHDVTEGPRECWDDKEIDEAYARIVIPSNPHWATDSEPDYPSVEHDHETFVRYHRLTIGRVSIYQCERNRGNVITLDPPAIDVASTHPDNHTGDLDVSQALALAADLEAAASRLRQIEQAELVEMSS